MKCKNETCDNQAKGNGKYCSATCKTIFNRNKRNTVTPPVTPVNSAVTPVTPTVTPAVTVTPVTPPSKGMTAEKFRIIKSKLAGGVSQPTGLPTAETAALSALDLRNRVSGYDGPAWMASPEYAEVCLRLVTWTKARLIESGQAVPAWKDTL